MSIMQRIIGQEPFSELGDPAERINKFLGRENGHAASPSFASEMSLVRPGPELHLDILENEYDYQLRVDVPGVRREDVKIFVEEGILAIEGERKQETEDKYLKVHRMERAYGNFHRKFALPPNVDATQIKAEFRDGVLVISLPKVLEIKHKMINIDVD